MAPALANGLEDLITAVHSEENPPMPKMVKAQTLMCLELVPVQGVLAHDLLFKCVPSLSLRPCPSLPGCHYQVPNSWPNSSLA